MTAIPTEVPSPPVSAAEGWIFPAAKEEGALADRDAMINRFIALTIEKKKLEALLAPIKKELAELSSDLVTEFQTQGDQRITRNGWTIYVKRDLAIRATNGDLAGFCDALRRAHLHELIGPTMSKVKAWLKGRFQPEDSDTWEIDKRKIPPSLRDKIDVGEFTTVSAKKA